MIVVVGIGEMGLAMAGRARARGHDVTGVDLLAERRQLWDAAGGVAIERLDEVEWSAAEAVLVVVRLTSEAHGVLRELAALVPRPLPCFVVTTLEHEAATRLGGFDAGALRLIELPVSGGRGGAEAGTLTGMAAGPHTAEDRALLEDFLERLVTFEEYGQPTMAKLLNNVAAAYNAATLSTILELGEEHGIDPASLHELLGHASGGSWIGQVFAELRNELLTKDVELFAAATGPPPSVDVVPVEELDRHLRAGQRRLAHGRTEHATDDPKAGAAGTA